MRDGLVQSRWAQILMVLATAGSFLCPGPVSAETPKTAPSNRLVNSANPYLLQHAYNPVDWYPWGEEAIGLAKKENKPIFLSVGYSTCYWCHVAERIIYSNATIAALMNQWFINIKVDREERPDIDETYMLARNLLTGSGGWPNNLFLTPDLKPFFAGSYLPPDDRQGRLGFLSILRLIHTTWEKDPAKVKATASEVHDALNRLREGRGKVASSAGIAPADWLAAARDHMLRRRDTMSGGFDGGGGAKFPRSPVLGLLLTDYRSNGTSASLQTVAETLDAIAFGGIHDHLAGGVHRYSTEPTWSVPHFEKMLYDNAQLLSLYADLYAITRQPLARQMAADIVGYLTGRMMAPEGVFYTAEDAEIEGKEGASYLWSRAEVVQALGDADANRFFAVYELTPLPSEPAGAGVLRVRLDRAANIKDRISLALELETLAPLRAKLLEVRGRREQPLRDEKIVVALNGLVIAALARSGAVFGQWAWVSAAKRAGDLLWNRAFDETGRLRRYLYQDQARGDGYLEDYALLALGYLLLAEASGEPLWSARARQLAEAIVIGFIEPDGRIVTTRANATLIVPAVDLQDHDTPSGTSAAYALLARLGKAEPRYADLAAKIVARMADKIEASPAAWANFTASAALFADPVKLGPSASALDSAAHVKATASLGNRSDELDEITVTIAIEPGFHANANPASLEYLIPTTVSVPGMANVNIIYPGGRTFKPNFLAEGISVYEGAVEVRVKLPHASLASAGMPSVNVEVQVCDLQTCLPPSTIALKVDR